MHVTSGKQNPNLLLKSGCINGEAKENISLLLKLRSLYAVHNLLWDN